MRNSNSSFAILHIAVYFILLQPVVGQCPQFSGSSITGNNVTLCEGAMVTLSVAGVDMNPGSTVDWYIAPVATFDPYLGEGTLIGSVPVIPDPNNPGDVIINDFTWTAPANFCETMGGGNYWITGILNPPPGGACMNIFTSYFALDISCPALILSGGGDVCAGNCPDDPTEINFTIIGDDVPFTADIVVSASLFPPFHIDGLEVNNGQSILVCLEGFFPSFDPVTGILSVPILAIGITATVEIVSMVSASGCDVSVDPNSLSLTFIAAPTSTAGADQTICAGETVNISGSIGGSATTSIWSTDGDGIFGDQAALNTTYTPGAGDIANGQVILTLMSMDQNGSCIPAESGLTVFIEPSLTIEVNTPLTICDNDVAAIVALVTGSNEPCLWETNGDGDFDDESAESTIYTPGPGDIMAGIVTLNYYPVNPDACLISSEPLIVNIVSAPDVDIPLDLEICEGDSIVIEIDITGPYANVVWSSGGDGTLLIESDTRITYTPGLMDIDDQFFIVSVVIQSVFPECGQITYNIPVDIILCDCPELETVPPGSPLCAQNDQIDLAALLVAGGSGSWSITNEPPGLNPATLTGNIFSTNMADPGMYTVTYTLNFPEPGCPASSSEQIMVNGPIIPDAGPDMAFCGAQAVLLFGQIVPDNGTPILWESLGDGTFGDNSALTTNYIPGPQDSISPGLYIVLHALDPWCGDQSDTVTLFFNEPPFTLFFSDTAIICNTSANGSVLDFSALIAGGDASGTWLNPFGVPVDLSNPSTVDFDGIANGFYLFQYRTNSAQSPCAETIYDILVSVEDCLCPLLIIQNLPGGICSSLPGLPLDAFIMAGAPGSWQIISTPPGMNPGTILGSTFIINGCDPGIYNLRFTLDAAPIPGCPDSAEIEIFIQEPPTLNIAGDTSTCGQSTVSLVAVVGGSATGVSWSSSGSGMYNDPNALNAVYTPSSNDVASTQVNLIATAVDTFGYCPVPKDTIILFLATPPSATFSTLIDTVCNQSDSGSIVNLASFIVQGDGTGFWTDLDGSMVDLSGPSQVDFDGVVQGNYRFVYSTQTALAPCTDSTYVFTVVVEDCACPPLMLSNTGLSLCVEDIADLNNLIINAAPGNWTITNGPATGIWPQIVGAELSTFGAAGGSYVLTYTLTDAVPGCQADDNISLMVEELPGITINSIECDPAQVNYDVLVQTDGASLTSDFGTVTVPGSGQFMINAIPVGQDISILISTASGLCTSNLLIPAPDCNCTLFTEDIADTITFCPGDTFVLIPIITGAQGLAFSTWVTPYGTFMRPTLPLYREGEYIWIVKDEAGCEERDTFNAQFMGPGLTEYTIIPPTCYGFSDGQIIIDSITGGLLPFELRVDNGPAVSVSQTPYTISGLSVGNHLVEITDMIGCSSEMLINVYNRDFGSLSLGPDITIQKGDSTFIQLSTENIAIANITWDPQFPGQGVTSFWFAPEATTLVSVSVQDSTGCTYADQMLITVLEKTAFFVPNVFSPNGDQINDEFLIITNLPDDRIVSLEIFDRWGSLLYSQYSGGPYAWDGFSKGKKVQPGVYVYKLVWFDQAGKMKVKIGDVTVIR